MCVWGGGWSGQGANMHMRLTSALEAHHCIGGHQGHDVCILQSLCAQGLTINVRCGKVLPVAHDQKNSKLRPCCSHDTHSVTDHRRVV